MAIGNLRSKQVDQHGSQSDPLRGIKYQTRYIKQCDKQALEFATPANIDCSLLFADGGYTLSGHPGSWFTTAPHGVPF